MDTRDGGGALLEVERSSTSKSEKNRWRHQYSNGEPQAVHLVPGERAVHVQSTPSAILVRKDAAGCSEASGV